LSGLTSLFFRPVLFFFLSFFTPPTLLGCALPGGCIRLSDFFFVVSPNWVRPPFFQSFCPLFLLLACFRSDPPGQVPSRVWAVLVVIEVFSSFPFPYPSLPDLWGSSWVTLPVFGGFSPQFISPQDSFYSFFFARMHETIHQDLLGRDAAVERGLSPMFVPVDPFTTRFLPHPNSRCCLVREGPALESPLSFSSGSAVWEVQSLSFGNKGLGRFPFLGHFRPFPPPRKLPMRSNTAPRFQVNFQPPPPTLPPSQTSVTAEVLIFPSPLYSPPARPS